MIEAKLQRCEVLLDKVEQPLRDFVIAHGIESELMEEQFGWDEATRQPRFHAGGLEDYGFEKKIGEGGRRTLRWFESGNCFHIEIFADGQLENFILAATLGAEPFGQIDQNPQSVRLPEDLAVLPQLLEEKYRSLQKPT